MDDVTYLIRLEHRPDEALNMVPVETGRRLVYVTVHSIRESTFYAAGRHGPAPDLRLDTFFLDYQGEEELEYRGQRYHIERTYLVPETERMELTIRKVASVHSKTGEGG